MRLRSVFTELKESIDTTLGEPYDVFAAMLVCRFAKSTHELAMPKRQGRQVTLHKFLWKWGKKNKAYVAGTSSITPMTGKEIRKELHFSRMKYNSLYEQNLILPVIVKGIIGKSREKYLFLPYLYSRWFERPDKFHNGKCVVHVRDMFTHKPVPKKMLEEYIPKICSSEDRCIHWKKLPLLLQKEKPPKRQLTPFSNDAQQIIQ